MVVSVNFRRKTHKPGVVTTQPVAEPKAAAAPVATGGGYAEVKRGANPPSTVPFKVSKERLKKFVNLQL